MANQPMTVQDMSPTGKKMLLGCGGIVFAFFLIIVVAVATGPSKPPKGSTIEEKLLSRAGAHRYDARDAVRARLNHPKTADFSIASEVLYVIDTANFTVGLTGVVAAKNSFGVEDDLKYLVVMRLPDTKTWSLESVDLVK